MNDIVTNLVGLCSLIILGTMWVQSLGTRKAALVNQVVTRVVDHSATNGETVLQREFADGNLKWQKITWHPVQKAHNGVTYVTADALIKWGGK